MSGISSSPTHGGADISIGRIAITGVDPGTARTLGPAIQSVIENAAQQGTLAPGHRPHLHLELATGATTREIANALARALERG